MILTRMSAASQGGSAGALSSDRRRFCNQQCCMRTASLVDGSNAYQMILEKRW